MSFRRLALALSVAGLFAAQACAQSTSTGQPSTGTAPTPSTSNPAPSAAPGSTGAAADNAANAVNNVAGPNENQAVRTKDATGTAGPAKGHNSFTRGQAAGRLRKHGYTNVSGLAKDSDGVWRGTATKDGGSVQVWVDYKGDVGQQ